MPQRHAEVFRAVRPDVLARLVEVRGSIDQTFTRIAPEVIRSQFDMVLDRMQSYLVTHELESYRSFAARWMAMRVSSGEPPQNLIHAVVAIGDVVTKTAQGRLGPGPEYQEFAREIARMTFLASRMLVEQLGEELARRQAQLQAMGGGR